MSSKCKDKNISENERNLLPKANLTMSESYRLQVWEEAVGKLTDVKENEGYCLAMIGPVCVAFPRDLAAKLRGMQGKRIGILRADANDYRIRYAKEKGQN